MSGFSLALLRHRLAAARDQSRRPRAAMAPDPRPEGRLLWAHLGAGVDPRGVRYALEDVRRMHPDLHILTTGRGPHPWLSTDAPSDTPSDADTFLGDWSPDIAVFSGNEMFPTLWEAALRRGTACIGAELLTSREPLALIEPLKAFDAVLSRDADMRLGPVCEAVGALGTVPSPPPARPKAVDLMSETLGTRPVWFAVGVAEAEIGEVLIAHERASRMAHRLLLVLDAPPAPAAAALDSAGWRWRSRVSDEVPSGDTQVLLLEAEGEAGLWLRIAPVTFLGGTLQGGGPSLSPYAPAALGSALIHGAYRGKEEEAFRRLRSAAGTRRIESADALGTEVERLLSPDLAAELAQAGWQVTSEGAEASARLVEVIDETLAGLPD